LGIILESLENIVREKMSDLAASAHSFDHVQRVYDIATLIAEQEQADIEVVQVGALLHDIGRIIGDPHSQNGVALARDILQTLQHPADKINVIANIIAQHDLKGQPKTLEEQIVWDADKIDLLGIMGIVKTFHYAGETQRSFDEACAFCFNRLHTIFPMLHTRTAQKIAQKRNAQLLKALKLLDRELKLTDMPL
jgi:uncharacterized protein